MSTPTSDKERLKADLVGRTLHLQLAPTRAEIAAMWAELDPAKQSPLLAALRADSYKLLKDAGLPGSHATAAQIRIVGVNSLEDQVMSPIYLLNLWLKLPGAHRESPRLYAAAKFGATDRAGEAKIIDVVDTLPGQL